MKKQRYIVEIEMPDGDFISDGWLKDLIQADCDMEDEGRNKVTVQETSLPSNLDEAAEEALDDVDANWQIDERGDGCSEPGYNLRQMLLMFKSGAEWMAGQGVSFDTEMSLLDSFGFQIGWPEDTSIFDCFNPGDKVVVQIRK